MKESSSVSTSRIDADVPVELARRLVGAGHEHAEHVQPDGDDHGVGAPAVQLAHDAERHLLGEVDDVHVGVVHRGPVVEHQQQAGEGLDQEQEEREPAHAPGELQPDAALADLHRVQVQEDVASAPPARGCGRSSGSRGGRSTSRSASLGDVVPGPGRGTVSGVLVAIDLSLPASVPRAHGELCDWHGLEADAPVRPQERLRLRPTRPFPAGTSPTCPPGSGRRRRGRCARARAAAAPGPRS